MSDFEGADPFTTWVAGFFEGEGTVYSHRSASGMGIHWKIPQKDQSPLLMVMSWLEKIGVQGRIRKEPKRDCYVLSVTLYPDVEKIYGLLYKFLSPRRQEQFDEAIEYFLENSIKYGAKT